MAVIKKGTAIVDIGFIKLGADFDEADRQCAWELYTELATRIAVTGKSQNLDFTDFSGEIFSESLSSLHAFFVETRKILRQFPVGSIAAKGIENHLGALMHRAMRDVLRPFLETWQSDYRHWWENISNKDLPPFERQIEYPKLTSMLSHWSDLRSIMRAIQDKIEKKYKLIDFTKIK